MQVYTEKEEMGQKEVQNVQLEEKKKQQEI